MMILRPTLILHFLLFSSFSSTLPGHPRTPTRSPPAMLSLLVLGSRPPVLPTRTAIHLQSISSTKMPAGVCVGTCHRVMHAMLGGGGGGGICKDASCLLGWAGWAAGTSPLRTDLIARLRSAAATCEHDVCLLQGIRPGLGHVRMHHAHDGDVAHDDGDHELVKPAVPNREEVEGAPPPGGSGATQE